MAQGLFGEAACGDIYTVSEAVIDTTLNIMALPAVRAYLDSIGLSDPDLLMSIAETVDGWEKGIQAFEAVATCPAGTFASLREHLLNHRRLVLDLGPATFDKVLFDFRVRSPTYVVDAAPSSTSVASPSSALPRTLPGRLMPGKRRKVTSSTSSHPNSTSLRHSVLHQYECDLRDFWLRRLGVLRSRAAAYVELQDLPVLPGEDVLILSLGTGAWRTLRGHIRRFEVFEKFLSPEPAWPLEMDKVLRYSAALSHKPGFTLIDSFVGTCSWILRRFQLPPLPLPNPMLEALKARVLERQGAETREVTEAIGVPLKLAKLLEERMLLDESQQPVFALVTFQILTLMWASMRFDDGLHIAPSSIVIKPEGLILRSWQTKTERKRRGTKYVIGRISFTQDDWVLRGYNIFMNSTPLEYRQGISTCSRLLTEKQTSVYPRPTRGSSTY